MSDLAFLFPSGLTPALTLATLDRHLGWALALAAVTLFMLQRAPRLVRLALGATVFMITLAPTTWSLSHSLGLAYQTPSLVTQGLALLYLLRVLSTHGAVRRGQSAMDAKWPLSTLLVAIAMGWILMLDTFAIFPVPVYAYGYSTTGPIFGLVLACAFWVISMRSSSVHEGRRARDLAIILLAAIAIHTFTRLPSGNAWDAMLDPWLWLVAHGPLVSRIARFAKTRFKNGKERTLVDKAKSPATITRSPESPLT